MGINHLSSVLFKCKHSVINDTAHPEANKKLLRLLALGSVFVFFLPFQGISQNITLAPQPAQFIIDVETMMTGSKNTEAAAVGKSFAALWNSNSLTSAQREDVMRISQIMLKKKLKARPHFQDFYGALVAAVNQQGLPETDLSDFLSVTEKVIENYDNKALNAYLQTLREFFTYRTLYYSSYSQLRVKGGTIGFKFIDDAPQTPVVVATENSEAKTKEDGWFNDWDTPVAEDNSWSSDWGTDETAVATEKVDDSPVITQIPQPDLQGAVIIVDKADLVFYTKFDSAALVNTSGSFMVKDNLFVGDGGKFNWQLPGLSADFVFVEFSKFNFNVTKPYLDAENVQLTYKGKIDQPVEGVFEFKSENNNGTEKSRYPRFKSYLSDIKVNGLGQNNLVYKGGFALAGNKIFSSSVFGGLASIEIKGDAGTKFRALSDRFSIQDTLLSADRAAIVIYHQRDSILHPAVQFKYNSEKSLLTLVKDLGGFKSTAFFASYFNMDITADMIKWDLNADSLDISILNAKNQIPALFESQEYFNIDRFNSLTGIYDFHPLQMVVGYARKINSGKFYSIDMARNFKQNPETMKGAMVFLMQNGFIDYNPQTDQVKVRRKGYHYVLSKSEKKDFDNMSIASLSPKKPNGTFNFKSQELKVRGIKKFYLSEALNVYIHPTNDEITLLDNRNLMFDGKVNAGNFEYIGQDFQFKYDSFLVTLTNIDSIRFNIDTQEKDSDNKIVKRRLDNQLVQTSGTLFINKPDNKSAKKTYPQYPIFSSTKGATVYFDKPEVLGGLYNKSVYFEIPPFEIDSVNSSDPKSIGFAGTFVSGGILPAFQHKLKVMPDQSLGFDYTIPEEGLQLYGGEAKVLNDLKLDNKGLTVNGKLNFLSSTLSSEKFTFYLDSANAVGKEFYLKEGDIGVASFPEVSLVNYRMSWIPAQDSMFIKNEKDAFQLYGNTATLNGEAILTSKGLYGNGILKTRGSEARSQTMNFKENDFFARHANFKINTDNPKKPAFSGKDVRLNFNLLKNEADISPEVEGVAALDFPYAQVRTSITKATWDLEDKNVRMTKPEDVDISNSYFYTTRKELDSLVFNATGAVYDINQLKLNVTGIPFIKVADAKITPDKNEVLILENAELQKLTKATLVIDDINEYHRLTDGNIKIISSKKFEGDATYQYVNTVADTFAIKFASFNLREVKDKKGNITNYTVSSGKVDESQNFLVAPGIFYKGDVTMYANKVALELDGSVKLDLKNIPNYDTWIKYQSSGDQKEIAFDFDNSVTDKGEPLNAGLHLENGTNALYGTFLNDMRTIGDQDFFTPSGLLSYDAAANEYQIESASKKAGTSFQGKIFTYNEENSDIKMEGPFQFLGSGQKFGMNAAGKGKGNIKTNEYSFNTFMVLDFAVVPQAMDMMAVDLKDVIDRIGAPSAHADRTALLYKAAEIIGDKAAKAYEKASLEDYIPLVTSSNELIRNLVISDVDLKWSEKQKAWYSTSKISISNILRTDINARLDGFMEIKKTDLGDIVNIFIQASPATWYAFNFENNRLILSSSNDDFNGLVRSKSNASKAKIGEFVFVDGDVAEALTFVNRFRKTYFDINEPYQLNMPSELVDDKEEFNTIMEDKKSEETGDDDGF